MAALWKIISPGKRALLLTSSPPFPLPPNPPLPPSAYWKTDFGGSDHYVVATTANYQTVHGVCQTDQLEIVTRDDGLGYFECASHAPLPLSLTGVYDFATVATAAVPLTTHYDAPDRNGNTLYAVDMVEYVVDCEGVCLPPSAPPLHTVSGEGCDGDCACGCWNWCC